MKPTKEFFAVGTLVVLFIGFVAVVVDYTNHQKPIKIENLNSYQTTIYESAVDRIEMLDQRSRRENFDRIAVFRATGQILPSNTLHFAHERKQAIAEIEAILNSPEYKTQGFGYVTLNYLGFVK